MVHQRNAQTGSILGSGSGHSNGSGNSNGNGTMKSKWTPTLPSPTNRHGMAAAYRQLQERKMTEKIVLFLVAAVFGWLLVPSSRTSSRTSLLSSNGSLETVSTKSATRIPTVLLAGTQKASTSALAVYLMNLANTCFSDADEGEEGGHGKEPHFFDEKYSGGLDFYRYLFRKCSDDALLIDGTPETMMHPDKVKTIYEQQGTAKDVRIIFILREPVAREISWYNHKLRYAMLENKPNWTDTMFDAQGNMQSFIKVHRSTLVFNFADKQYEMIYGYYSYWLKEWAKLFDRQSQILVLSYDELVTNPQSMLKRVHAFLDLPIGTNPLQLSRENTNSKRTPDPSCVEQLEVGEYFKGPNKELYQYLKDVPGPSMEQRPFPKFAMKCPPTVPIPSILFAGFTHSGITTVADYFRHRRVSCFANDVGYEGLAERPHFFTATPKFKKGLAVYRKTFEKCDYTRNAMDAAPSIILHPHRVKKSYDEQGQGSLDVLKIVLVLREPVASHLFWSESIGQDPLLKSAGGVAAVMEKQRKLKDGDDLPETVVHADYVHWLKRWIKIFDRKQILILSHEELVRDPDLIVKRVGNFIEQELYGPFEAYNAVMNETRTIPKCDEKVQSELQTAFAASTKELYQFLEDNPGSDHEQKPFPRFEFECTGK